MEGVLAAFAQFDNDVRSDRTRAGMRAALELGRWTFPAPLGYLNAPKWSKTSLIQDPERGPLVRSAFEDLATLVDEATFYRVQVVLDGRIVVAGPRQRNHPDVPLRGFVRCEMCGRPLTGSWSKGRDGHYEYYHCQRQCRAVNVSKAELEGSFADELALLQPTTGYMRLIKDRILHVWEQRRVEAKDRTAEQEKRVKIIQQKLDRLDEAFLFAQSIDATSYERQRDRLREELTLAQIDHHAEAVDELDVQGILAFAERILPQRHHFSTTWRRPRVLMKRW
jgi:hypothetical protein